MRKGWDLWVEGKYFDLWSVNHFLAGLLIAATLFLLKISLFPAFLIAFLLFIAYEIFEVAAQIEEVFTNRLVDVIVDVAGFSAATYFFFVRGQPFSVPAIIIIVLLFVVLEIMGFTAWVKRTKRKGEKSVDIKKMYH